MAEFLQMHTPEWLAYFIGLGYHEAEPLAAGVEGAVYRLETGTVAKVWGKRRRPELLLVQAFYADVAKAGLPFATPVILRVEEVDEIVVTFERELHGEPLQKHLASQGRELASAVSNCLIEVLRSLSSVCATDNMRQLAVLDEDRPLWHQAANFPAALVALLERRVARFGDLLRSRVPDFDHRYARVRKKIYALDRPPPVVVHGNLFGQNILVDEALRPTAVLDFGFLSTAGDPRLDASISAVIMNMYGPHAATIARTLTDHLADVLGYSTEVLVLFQTAYAIATSNAFTADGSDGHFQWCLNQLIREEVDIVLDL